MSVLGPQALIIIIIFIAIIIIIIIIIIHTIFECPKLDDVRGDFLQKLETIFLQKLQVELETNAATDCLALLMGDDPPQEIENSLYRFLTSLFKRRLGILAAQGPGECP